MTQLQATYLRFESYGAAGGKATKPADSGKVSEDKRRTSDKIKVSARQRNTDMHVQTCTSNALENFVGSGDLPAFCHIQ